MTIAVMKKIPPGIYAITPDIGPDEARWALLLEQIQAALSVGLPLLQYREKSILPFPLRQTRAAELHAMCRAHGCQLIINDDIKLALEVEADGVHLGREDVECSGGLTTARQRLKGRLLGVSCYNEPARANEATEAGADYIAFGAFFPSPTKPQAPQAGTELITLAKQRHWSPVCAIGGITIDNAPPLIRAGARWLAVISELFSDQWSAAETGTRAQQFRRLFHDNSPNPQ